MFESYFSSAFRNDESNDPQLIYPVNIGMHHFIISVEDVLELISLNLSKSEGADEIYPKILDGLACYLVTLLAKIQ